MKEYKMLFVFFFFSYENVELHFKNQCCNYQNKMLVSI